jgi:HK97 family phage prohead protease
VHGITRPTRTTPAATITDRHGLGAIEYRSAPSIDVDRQHRLIRVLAVPYGVDAVVQIRGNLVSESFSNTAFANGQPQHIFATRDHDQRRLIGKITTLEPFHADGLHAVIQASNTPLGIESVELARDEVIAASIGFTIPSRDGEIWEGRARRRVIKALLREVSLVPEPAYPTRVIDVCTHT